MTIEQRYECNGESLLKAARAAALRAYAPYSHFRVGAAVATEHGVFEGSNVENASYPLAICAERNAIFQAVSAGETRITGLAVACIDAPPGAPIDMLVPCGACRQVISEFAGPEVPVWIDGVGVLRLKELLPFAFRLR